MVCALCHPDSEISPKPNSNVWPRSGRHLPRAPCRVYGCVGAVCSRHCLWLSQSKEEEEGAWGCSALSGCCLRRVHCVPRLPEQGRLATATTCRQRVEVCHFVVNDRVLVCAWHHLWATVEIWKQKRRERDLNPRDPYGSQAGRFYKFQACALPG